MICPICQRGTDAKYQPFCSKRCADVDLARWLTGGYAIAATETDLDEASSDEDGSGDGGARSERPLRPI
jgi:endogenous inhibitor of DNA gyrase (YacG/DUF329 family)